MKKAILFVVLYFSLVFLGTFRQIVLKFSVVVDDYANREGTLDQVQALIGTNLHSINLYRQFGRETNKDLHPELFAYAKGKGMSVTVAWEPWDPELKMAQTTNYLASIVDGEFDYYIIKFAHDIQAYGDTITIRFAPEMNGNWRPWGEQPAEYIKAYRYVVILFSQLGVTNVKWEWNVNVIWNDEDPSIYYPGDDVVDIIGIDGYNWGLSQGKGGHWLSFAEVFGPTYNYLNWKYKKPFIIAETASAEDGGDKGQWVKEMFEWLWDQKNIFEVVWFDKEKETDWRIDSSKRSLEAFQRALSS